MLLPCCCGRHSYPAGHGIHQAVTITAAKGAPVPLLPPRSLLMMAAASGPCCNPPADPWG
jgi:hypothetical protein